MGHLETQTNTDAEVPTGRIRCILVADDDASIRRLIAKRFETAGYRVFQAPHGEEAARLAAQHRPDAIITDWNMPKLDGIGLAERVREQQAEAATPLILLTARDFAIDQDAVTRLQIARVICKPFSARKLVEAVAQILDERDAQAPEQAQRNAA
jgi:DNA-binding response OmpR family regulator